VDIAGQSQVSYGLGGFNLAISPKGINAISFLAPTRKSLQLGWVI
jgi:hypothetical protein